jgi:hypothetical protein
LESSPWVEVLRQLEESAKREDLGEANLPWTDEQE